MLPNGVSLRYGQLEVVISVGYRDVLHHVASVKDIASRRRDRDDDIFALVGNAREKGHLLQQLADAVGLQVDSYGLVYVLDRSGDLPWV